MSSSQMLLSIFALSVVPHEPCNVDVWNKHQTTAGLSDTICFSVFTGLRDGTRYLDTLSIDDFSFQILVLSTPLPIFEPLLSYTPGVKIYFSCRFTRTVYLDFHMLQWHGKRRLRRKNKFQIKQKPLSICADGPQKFSRWTVPIRPILTRTTRTHLTTEVIRPSHLTTTETVVQLLLLCNTQWVNRSFIAVRNNNQRNRTQSAFQDFRFLEFPSVPSSDALMYAEFSTSRR